MHACAQQCTYACTHAPTHTHTHTHKQVQEYLDLRRCGDTSWTTAPTATEAPTYLNTANPSAAPSFPDPTPVPTTLAPTSPSPTPTPGTGPPQMPPGYVNCTDIWSSATAQELHGVVDQSRRYSPQIMLASVIGTSFLAFTYASSPDVSLSIFNAPSSGNALIRLFGHDFDINDRSHSATLGGTFCLTTSWSSWTVLQCRARFFFSLANVL